jgi:hypothetical protein
MNHFSKAVLMFRGKEGIETVLLKIVNSGERPWRLFVTCSNILRFPELLHFVNRMFSTWSPQPTHLPTSFFQIPLRIYCQSARKVTGSSITYSDKQKRKTPQLIKLLSVHKYGSHTTL